MRAEIGDLELRRALGLKTQEHDRAIRDYLVETGHRDGERIKLEDDTVYMRISGGQIGRHHGFCSTN